MADPLEKYRRKPPAGEVPDGEDPILPDDEKTYMAYRPANKPKRLIVRRRKEAHRAPGYSYLIDMMWDADAGQEIGLVYSHSTFMIRGKNLQDLAVQLASERVASIREFDPSKWERPAKDEPIIESIEVTTKVTAPLSGEGKKEG